MASVLIEVLLAQGECYRGETSAPHRAKMFRRKYFPSEGTCFISNKKG